MIVIRHPPLLRSNYENFSLIFTTRTCHAQGALRESGCTTISTKHNKRLTCHAQSALREHQLCTCYTIRRNSSHSIHVLDLNHLKAYMLAKQFNFDSLLDTTSHSPADTGRYGAQ
jgi:hypothetical protein